MLFDIAVRQETRLSVPIAGVSQPEPARHQFLRFLPPPFVAHQAFAKGGGCEWEVVAGSGCTPRPDRPVNCIVSAPG